MSVCKTFRSFKMVAMPGFGIALLLSAFPVSAAIDDLVVAKLVQSDQATIEAGETVAYITSPHFSGDEAREFSLIEVIPAPLQVNGPPSLVIQSGQLSSTRVTVETRPGDSGDTETVLRWRGVMAAGQTRFSITTPIRTEVACHLGQAQVELLSAVEVLTHDGSDQSMTVSRSYAVQCPPMASLADIEVELAVEFEDDETSPDGLASRVADGHDRYANQAVLYATLSNHGSLPATLGLRAGLRPAAVEPPGVDDRFATLLLEPGEFRTLEIWTDMRPFLHPFPSSPLGLASGGSDDTFNDIEAVVDYVLLPNIASRQPSYRPGPSDDIQQVVEPIRLRAWDLGDAPDSSNRAGVVMEAYPGIQASFASVFDSPPSALSGPAHARPRLLHLGRSVSLEADADLGPNANLLPEDGLAGRDRHNDGAWPSSWSLSHCEATTIEVQVFISRAVVAWFADQQQPAFLNAWIDANRDGQWGQVVGCPVGRAFEHFVIDYPVDVAALGPGYHILEVPTGRINWPEQLSNLPAWIRLTLAEAPSVKIGSVGGISFGDGRGAGEPWLFGETEDFLLRPSGSSGAGPNLEVRLQGEWRGRTTSGAERFNFQKVEWQWIMSYANIGSQTAEQVTRIFEFPQQVTSEQIEADAIFTLVAPRRDAQTVYIRIPPNRYSIQGSQVIFNSISLEPGESGHIVVHYIPDLDSDSSGLSNGRGGLIEWLARAEAITQGDVDIDNRVASFKSISGMDSETEVIELQQRIAMRSPQSPFWVRGGTTSSQALHHGGFIPTGETGMFLDGQGNLFPDLIANQGFFNLWVQVIESSSAGNDVGVAPGTGELQLLSLSEALMAGRGEYLAPGVYVEETSFMADGRWELSLDNLPDAHYRIAVGDPRACDGHLTRLIGDEFELIGDEWGLVGDEWELIGRPGPAGGAAGASCALFTVDSSLPIDPISLGFVAVPKDGDLSELISLDPDGHPRIHAPVTLPDTLGFGRGDWSLRLPPSDEESEYVAVFALKPDLVDPEPRLIDRYGDQQLEVAAVETAIPAFYRSETFFFDEADALFGSRGDGEPPPRRDMIVQLSLGANERAFAGQPTVASPGRIRIATTQPALHGTTGRQPVSGTLQLLVGVPLRGEMVFIPWNGDARGQTGRVLWDIDEETGYGPYQLSVPRGIYQLLVEAEGFQTYRSAPFRADGPIEREIVLQPQSLQAPSQIVVLDQDSMTPSYTEITPGGIVRLVNLGTRALVLGVDDLETKQAYHAVSIERGGYLQPGQILDLVVGDDGGITVFDRTQPALRAEVQVFVPVDVIFRDRFSP
jgi:hypothetical protein